MKFYILPVLILFSSLNLVSQSINWVTMDKALELQKNTPKNIMIDIYTTWCGPCKMLDKNTFTNKDLITFVNANYYAVKFNAEGNESVNYKNRLFENPNYDPAKAKRRNSAHQFSQYLGVRAYPTIVFLDDNAELIAPIPGYQTVQKIEIYLQLFKDQTYKDINSQEAFNTYYKSFKPTFTL
ncbi:MAG: thioredoxin fold domain-containing protein [Formosa sp.]|jgi:thioredoxin-related protein|nr:thioredoxin fold domain-containing protein [Formosa sp.]MDC0463496.1 thioredoxin fold domain-containing protein [Flavobacteriaceae bacterium]